MLTLVDSSRFKGVTYYDPHLGGWAVVEPAGRRLPRHASPTPERDTFVVYDDARCRGADLRLRPDAVGLVTLGPGINKDKVMQVKHSTAAGGSGFHTSHMNGVYPNCLRLSDFEIRTAMVHSTVIAAAKIRTHTSTHLLRYYGL